MVRALPVALLVALAAACGGGGADGGGAAGETSDPAVPTTVSPVPATAVQLSATVTRSSLFDSQRTFRLELRNDGDAEVTVDTLVLRSGRFVPLAPSERDTRLAVGRQVLVPLPFGAAVCPGGSGPATVAVVIDGREVQVEPAQRPASVLEDLHALECDQEAVRDAVDLSFGDEWAATGSQSATGEVRVEVRGQGAPGVEVGAVTGNIVFGVRLGPGTLPTGSSFPVEVVLDRCDVHALIESKRTFKFPLDVRLGSRPPITYVLEATPGTVAREVLEGLIEACVREG